MAPTFDEQWRMVEQDSFPYDFERYGLFYETWSDAGQGYVRFYLNLFRLCFTLLLLTTSRTKKYRVKTRLASGNGMSFSEFTYPLMQAWDWWTLFQKGFQVQVGGSDQFGNILFGIDAVKAASRNTEIEELRNPLENELDHPVGLTTPLLTNSSGEKLGKSSGNAIWLDKDMTSSFELYQVRLLLLLHLVVLCNVLLTMRALAFCPAS